MRVFDMHLYKYDFDVSTNPLSHECVIAGCHCACWTRTICLWESTSAHNPCDKSAQISRFFKLTLSHVRLGEAPFATEMLLGLHEHLSDSALLDRHHLVPNQVEASLLRKKYSQMRLLVTTCCMSRLMRTLLVRHTIFGLGWEKLAATRGGSQVAPS